MAITWQNINAPNLGDPSRSLQAAQGAFNAGFEGLREQLKAYQTNEAQNFEIDRKNRLDATLSSVMSRYATPQALAEGRKSGELDQMLANVSPQDRLAAMTFMDNRNSVLEQRALSSLQFKDKETEIRLRPMLQQAQALAAKNDRAGLDALYASNPEFAGYYQGQVEQMAVAESRAQGKFTQDILSNQSQIQHQRATEEIGRRNADSSAVSASASMRQAGAAERQAANQAASIQLQDMERREKRLTELNVMMGTIGGGMSSEAGMKTIVDSLAKVVPDEKQRRQLMSAMGELARDPELSKLSPSAALQVLLSDVSTGGSIRNVVWDGTGDDVIRKARQVMRSPGYIASESQRQTAANQLRSQADELRSSLGHSVFGGVPGVKEFAAQPAPAQAMAAPAPAPVPTAGDVARSMGLVPSAPAKPAAPSAGPVNDSTILDALKNAKTRSEWKDTFLEKDFPNGRPSPRNADSRARYDALSNALDSRMELLRQNGFKPLDSKESPGK